MKIPKLYLTNGVELEFTWQPPCGGAKYTYALIGKDKGKPFMVHMAREGLKMLVEEMVKAL